MNNYPFNGSPFSFQSLPPSSSPFQFNATQSPQPTAESHSSGSRKRKNSLDEDSSPLFMKTRSGIGLEPEIVYDRTMTMMTEGQARYLAEQQRQRELSEQQQQQQLQMQQLQQQRQQHLQQQLEHQQYQQQAQQKESQVEAMRRLFMVGRRTTPPPTPQPQQYSPLNPAGYTFADCAGEINGCETNKIRGMRDRYQAEITPCTFCQRSQCQFCLVQCASCQEPSCRACCSASYEKSDVEYFCQGCRG